MADESILLSKAVAEDLDVGVARVEVPAPSGGYVIGNQINLSTFAIYNTRSWTPGTVADGGISGVLATANGAAVGSPCLASITTGLPTGCFLTAQVSSANTVTVTLHNESGSQIVVNATTLRVLVFPVPA